MSSKDMECTSLMVIPQPYSRIRNLIRRIKKYSYLSIKRAFDIMCSIIGLVFLLPIMLIIKTSYIVTGDFDKIIFVQKRIGKNGKEFKLYKFRTMVPHADRVLVKLLKENKELEKEYKTKKKLKNDPRITRIGSVLRKTSIDELPQIINILKGEMSVIGNRPYLPREKKDMGTYYDDITKTKPGLTGYWQVSGRNEISFKERLKLESNYSSNQSLLLDTRIFILTFKTVLFRKGAL